MIRSEIKNLNTILTQKIKEYQHYYQAKLIDMNILRVKKYNLKIKAE